VTGFRDQVRLAALAMLLVAVPVVWITIGGATGRFFLAVFGFAIVVACAAIVRRKITNRTKFREFLASESGRIYVVCTSRRKWRDFTINIVLPALPDDYGVVWQERRERHPRYRARGGRFTPSLITKFLRSDAMGVPKPCMILVTPQGLVHRSLYEDLEKLRENSQASEQLRAECRRTIVRIEEELRAQQRAPVRV